MRGFWVFRMLLRSSHGLACTFEVRVSFVLSIVYEFAYMKEALFSSDIKGIGYCILYIAYLLLYNTCIN
ncbi:MAG: hypothetical protein GXO64_04445 [Candidatus Micrarchaeota archaeon]|nr:hypothetical protein [Candidatus Micrarchaeota archaeon]